MARKPGKTRRRQPAKPRTLRERTQALASGGSSAIIRAGAVAVALTAVIAFVKPFWPKTHRIAADHAAHKLPSPAPPEISGQIDLSRERRDPE